LIRAGRCAEEVQYAIGLTSNDHRNTLFAGTCCSLHSVPVGLVGLAGSGSDSEFDQIRRFGGAVLFQAPLAALAEFGFGEPILETTAT
jgi:hypothetical protein